MLEYWLINWAPMFIKACNKTLISFITSYKTKKIAMFYSAKDKVEATQEANIIIFSVLHAKNIISIRVHSHHRILQIMELSWDFASGSILE